MLLPALRQDLSLHAGPAADDGSPTWTVHDPAANRYYRIGWAAFEILSRWHLRSVPAILQAIRAQTTLQADDGTLLEVLQFLAHHNLLDAAGAADSERLMTQLQAGKLSKAKWLLKNYLFFRVPLVRPARFLGAVSPYLRWAFMPRFWLALAIGGLLGLYLVSRQWDEFIHTFSAYNSFAGWLTIGIAVSFSKVLHEMGHAFTAQRFGCRVPTMGIAFLVMWPVLYTDTNDAWKLQDKRRRMAIGAAGMLSEIALAIVATLLWNVLPDGPLRAGAFLLATTTWIITLGINASPFMRFDGYFLLSDWLDMPNLHGRAFAFGRWWLRKTLFGWIDPAPENLSWQKQRFLIVFAFVTWLYRLVLFLGIALLVYHVFFKLLGIVLMIVELGWFIAKPVWSEVKVWWQQRSEIHWNKATKRSAIGITLILAFLLLPWQGDIRAPAIMGARDAQGLYAVAAAQVAKAPVAAGTQVNAGDILLELHSPDLAFRHDAAKVRAQTLYRLFAQQPFNTDAPSDGTALQERYAEAAAQLKALQEEADRLIVRAPFAGRVAEVNDSLLKGAWVAEKEKLFVVVGKSGAKGQAFIPESALTRLRGGKHEATFIADVPEQPKVKCQMEAVDRINVGNLDALALASTFGGPIPVQHDHGGVLVPTEALFRVRLENCTADTAPRIELRGVAHIEGSGASILGPLLRRGIAAVQREMGF